MAPESRFRFRSTVWLLNAVGRERAMKELKDLLVEAERDRKMAEDDLERALTRRDELAHDISELESDE